MLIIVPEINVLDDPFFQEPDQITIFCHKTEPDPITIFLPAKWARSDRDLDQIIPDHFQNSDLPLLITIFPQNWPSLPFLLHFYALIFFKDWKIGRIFWKNGEKNFSIKKFFLSNFLGEKFRYILTKIAYIYLKKRIWKDLICRSFFSQKTEPDPITIFLPAKGASSYLFPPKNDLDREMI